MLFGDVNDFAIEADIEPGLIAPSPPWGHMCVWCRGIPLGDINNLHCGLGGPHDGFQWLAANVDSLWDAEFEGLDDGAIWNFLDGMLYGYHGDVDLKDGRSVAQCRTDAQKWGRFDFLTNWDEPFDGCKAFLLCPPGGRVRILSRRSSPDIRQDFDVSRESLVNASRRFAQWLDEQTALLRGK